MSEKMKYTNDQLEQKIKEYGRDILTSDLYKEAFAQKHHHKTSVGKHSLRVAKETIRVCDFLARHGVEVDERKAVRAALLHDLGILGRDEKFASNFETSRRHPIESLRVAEAFEPEMDETMRQAIERHMFPVFAKPPTRPEAIAVCMADKVASAKDLFSKRSTRKRPHPVKERNVKE